MQYREEFIGEVDREVTSEVIKFIKSWGSCHRCYLMKALCSTCRIV
jgi:hypothetical protein